MLLSCKWFRELICFLLERVFCLPGLLQGPPQDVSMAKVPTSTGPPSRPAERSWPSKVLTSTGPLSRPAESSWPSKVLTSTRLIRNKRIPKYSQKSYLREAKVRGLSDIEGC